VYTQITEGEKTRTQFFRGVVLQRRGSGATETFTIRKMSGNVGVERIFPVNLPAIEKIEVNKRGKVRRARIFYQRERTGKAARIKEWVMFSVLQLLHNKYRPTVLGSSLLRLITGHWATFTVALGTQPRSINAIAVQGICDSLCPAST